jgi:hypothetical protein
MLSHTGRLWNVAVSRPLVGAVSVDGGALAMCNVHAQNAIPKLLRHEYPQQRKINCQRHEGNLQSLSAFECGPGLPRTSVLGHSQSVLSN